MGMHVTDEEITRFLQELSSDRLTAEQFAQILQGISGRRSGLSRRQLYDALRTELLAKRLTDGLVGSSQAPWEGFAATLQATPAERWESYQRLNNRAVIEAVPVAVADFLDKVPDPDDTAVRTLYERYKEYEPIPGAPVPGFKIPAKVALQYVTADYEKFEEVVAVTDQEIHDEYEKNKNTRYLKRPDFDTGSQEPAAGGEQPPTPGLDDAQPQGDAQPQDDGEQKPADAPAASEAAPAADEPATDAKRDDGAAPDNKPPQQSRDAGNLHGVELALADVNQDASARTAEESKPASESAPSEPQADGQNPAATESQPAADGDKSAEPATEGAAPAEEQAAADAPAGDAASKYEPLEKVEPTIRSELGRQKAMKKMQEVLGQLREKMVKYGNERTRWELKHERDKTLRPPTPLDFDALAAEYHVTAHNTALVTALELRAFWRPRRILRRARDPVPESRLRTMAALSGRYGCRQRRQSIPGLEDRARGSSRTRIDRDSRQRRSRLEDDRSPQAGRRACQAIGGPGWQGRAVVGRTWPSATNCPLRSSPTRSRG